MALATCPVAASAVTCTVRTEPVSFGIYNPLSPNPAVSSGSVEAACTCAVVDCVVFYYNIEITAGRSGTTAARQMRSGIASIAYNLYQDPGYGRIWGTGSAGQSVLYLVALFGSYQKTTVWGRAPAGQSVLPGTYSDAPVVTISF